MKKVLRNQLQDDLKKQVALIILATPEVERLSLEQLNWQEFFAWLQFIEKYEQNFSQF